jgi:hypothetical protein
MRRIALMASVLGAAALLTAGLAVAQQTVTHPLVTPSVIQFDGAGSWACVGGIKLDPPTAGSYEFKNFDLGGGHIVTINLTISYPGGKLTFASTSGEFVTSVLVKGGPPANLYNYSGITPAVYTDSGLTPPINPNNGKPYGFSHLCFYFDKE